MKALLKRLKNDVFGGTAIEYGLICALIVVAMISAFEGFADVNENIWNRVSNEMRNASN
jgi:pilus assembly protein Flp/PilA